MLAALLHAVCRPMAAALLRSCWLWHCCFLLWCCCHVSKLTCCWCCSMCSAHTPAVTHQQHMGGVWNKLVCWPASTEQCPRKKEAECGSNRYSGETGIHRAPYFKLLAAHCRRCASQQAIVLPAFATLCLCVVQTGMVWMLCAVMRAYTPAGDALVLAAWQRR